MILIPWAPLGFCGNKEIMASYSLAEQTVKYIFWNICFLSGRKLEFKNLLKNISEQQNTINFELRINWAFPYCLIAFFQTKKKKKKIATQNTISS